jgi:hypothetical protein
MCHPGVTLVLQYGVNHTDRSSLLVKCIARMSAEKPTPGGPVGTVAPDVLSVELHAAKTAQLTIAATFRARLRLFMFLIVISKFEKCKMGDLVAS